LAQFDPITYIHLDLLVGGPDENHCDEVLVEKHTTELSKLLVTPKTKH